MYWLPYSSHTSHRPSQTPCLPWLSYATQKLMLDSCKMVEKQSEAFHTFLWHFSKFKTSLKQNFITYRSSKVSDCIFEIHQPWKSGFSRMYSNCCCSCSFEAEIIKIGQSSHKMYCNKILNCQESTTILNTSTKKSGNLLKTLRIFIYINCIDEYVYMYMCLCIYVHTYVNICIRLYICVYVSIYVYVCVP